MQQFNDPAVILVIDDEEAMRDSCRQVLAKEGHAVHAAADGSAGLAMVQEHKPDLVLLDLKMPGISGRDVLERINRIDDTIATVIITGYATISAAVESMRAGAYDFLPKPFTPKELRKVVRRSLDRRRAFLEVANSTREKSEAARYFVSMIRHEVVTPLKEACQSLSHLESDLSVLESADIREQLAYCATSIERIIHLVEKWQSILQSASDQEKKTAA